MFKIICWTAMTRLNKGEKYLERIEAIARSGIDTIALREPDLPLDEYRALSLKVGHICALYNVQYIVHGHPDIACSEGTRAVHLPLRLLRDMSAKSLKDYDIIGASCHSLKDAREATTLGATYITLGHIFSTLSHPDTPPCGLGVLKEVCSLTLIPVYAIGGVNPSNIADVKAAGASGAVIMGAMMNAPDIGALVSALKEAVNS